MKPSLISAECPDSHSAALYWIGMSARGGVKFQPGFRIPSLEQNKSDLRELPAFSSVLQVTLHPVIGIEPRIWGQPFEESLVGLTLIVGIYRFVIVWPYGWSWHKESHHLPHYLQMILGVYATLGVFLHIIENGRPIKTVDLLQELAGFSPRG